MSQQYPTVAQSLSDGKEESVMKTNIISVINALAIVTMFTLLAGCSGNSSSTQTDAGTSATKGTGSIVVALTWPQQPPTAAKTTTKSVAAAPAGVATIRITVSSSDMTPIQKSFTATAGSGTIDGVPAGTGRSPRRRRTSPAG